MTRAASDRSVEHIGETAGMQDHDRDLVSELGRSLDCLWRCDQYIANADGHKDLQEFWRRVKKEERQRVDDMRSLIRSEIDQDCF